MLALPPSTSPPATAPVTPVLASNRRPDLDWLRGLMLVLMTVTHLPTGFSHVLSQPFGFVSAAEGFVFLSAFLVGTVYARMAARRGMGAMQQALFLRAAKVYAAHTALLLFLLLVLVPLAARTGGGALTDLASFYVAHPREALVAGLVLTYNPPLLDILPLYVIFLAVSPWILAHAMGAGWRHVAVASALLWLAAQLGGGHALYDALAGATGSIVPYRETGAFSFFAWQTLWVAGLWAGARPPEAPTRGSADAWWSRPGVVRVAVAVAVVGMAWRHVEGQAPFGSLAHLNVLFDKWTLGPLRLVNFVALVLVAIHAQSTLRRWAEGSTLEALGRASLTVFCTHLVLCLVLLAVVGNAPSGMPGVTDALLLGGSLAILVAVAREASLREGRSAGAPAAYPRRGDGGRVSPAPRMAR